MNKKTKENVGGKIAAGMNKAELNALIDAVINTKFNQRIEDKKRDPKSTTDAIEGKKKAKKIKALKAMTSDEAYSMPKKKKQNPMSAAKGGMIKGYMGGGSVHKKKNKMATTKGWGASRKT